MGMKNNEITGSHSTTKYAGDRYEVFGASINLGATSMIFEDILDTDP